MNESGGSLHCCVGSEPPYYVGLRQKPAKTLLEAILAAIGSSPTYRQVIVGTARGEHLPREIMLNDTMRIGSVPLFWYYRGQKLSNAPQGSNGGSPRGDNQQLRYAEELAISQNEAGRRIIDERQEASWGLHAGWLIDQLTSLNESAAGVGRTLFIIDLELLMPDTQQLSSLFQESMRDTSHSKQATTQNLQDEFDQLFDQIRNARNDLVYFTWRKETPQLLKSGDLIRSVARKYMRIQDQRFQHLDDEHFGKIDAFSPTFPLLRIDALTSSLFCTLEKDIAFPGAYTAFQPELGEKSLCDVIRKDVPQRKVSVRDELDELIGLKSVKQQFYEWCSVAQANRDREALGIRLEYHFNCVMEGNPGTGKTEVSKLVGKLLAEQGLLSGTQFTEVTSKDLIGEYVGQTRIKTNEVVEKALGGVLFIDEAYDLVPRHGNDFAVECVTTLLKWLDEHPRDIAFVIAGYEKDIETFLDSNAGLRRRFPQTFKFEDYDDDQLTQIVKAMMRKMQQVLDGECDAIIKKRLTEIRSYRRRQNQSFGNAGEARILIQMACIARDVRTADLDGTWENRVMLTADDFANAKLFPTP
ncbi:AAA family ATPase [Blastopirellula sp. JC732]|uniref:AAA family ATPase n=1 Tax=Blastopirellula sediminis TaxID=2894196 RepID=A0A9X1MIV2_9BACT|nr:AAA family ATPase [Blastopirellula sediminis]MCC9608100.1 AAA family ATPase [Blastopirellula sediminis]MCC9627107.1 AAA family ATPase [Blastopirellula sediminis]